MNSWIAAVINVLSRAEPTGTLVPDSPYWYLHYAEEHNHSVGMVYPTAASGVTLTCGTASSWDLGTVVQVVPASTITSEFDLHFLSIENLSANAVYEIVLYQGAGDTEIGRVRVTKNAIMDGTVNVPIQTPIIAANARIRAAVMSSTGAADTATISVMYHTY